MVSGDQIFIEYEESRSSRPVCTLADPVPNVLGSDAIFFSSVLPFPFVCIKMQELVGALMSLTSQCL